MIDSSPALLVVGRGIEIVQFSWKAVKDPNNKALFGGPKCTSNQLSPVEEGLMVL